MRFLIAAAFAAAALGCAPPAELTGEASLAAMHPIVGGQYTGTLDSIYFGAARELTLDLECGPEAGGWAEYVSPDISCFSVITFVGATDDARFYEDTTLSGCPEGLLVLRAKPPDGIHARWSVPGDTMTTEEGYLHLTDPSRCEPCEDCAPAPGAMPEPVPETSSGLCDVPDGNLCDGGMCISGACVPTAASGSGSCDDGNPCTNDYRVSLGPTSAFCVHPKKADGTVCGGDPTKDDYGRCDNGICAWTNWTCVDGGAGASCGDDIDGTCTSDGVCCYGCIDSTGACQDVECWGLLNGAACPDDNVCIDGGTCGYMTIDGIIQGECITGLCCLDPATCQTPACGEYGDVSVSAAASCDDGNPCSLDHRVWLGPSSSYCAHKALPGGTECTVGSCTGTCYPPKLDGTPGHCSCGGGLSVVGCNDGNPCTIDKAIWLGPSSMYCIRNQEQDGTVCGAIGDSYGVCVGGSCAWSSWGCDPPPKQCATSNDCFINQCADSWCDDGVCKHATKESGLTCFGGGGNGIPTYIGTCDECTCN